MSTTAVTHLEASLYQLATEAGFHAVAVAPAAVADSHVRRYRHWVAAGHHAGMDYLDRHEQVRADPGRLLKGARSVICLAVSYAPAAPEPTSPFIARYARGGDYHKLLKRRCKALMARLADAVEGFEGRAFVDAAPIMERTLAAAAGLGWIGRNGCLIVPGLGSYVVLAEIVCNLPLTPGRPLERRCGKCRRCLAACPTGALLSSAEVDCRRCLSYLTIEHPGPIPEPFRAAVGNRLFGCDTCQAVCPHNADVPAGDAELTGGRPAPPLKQILAWTEPEWDACTRGRAMRRAKLPQWLRNAVIVTANTGGPAEEVLLRDVAACSPEFRELLRWASRSLAGQGVPPAADRP